MKNLRVTNFGQIKEADINFGDLTLFVGPQATGKSILLQLLKLLLDRRKILLNLHEYGYELYDLLSSLSNFLELYFGEGMNNIWGARTEVYLDEQITDLENLINIAKIISELRQNSILLYECLFMIPAQRVITLENGWPRPFLSFEIGDPYVVRNFSEQLRIIMQQKDYLISTKGKIFPNARNLTEDINYEINKSIFHGASVVLKTAGMRNKIYIELEGNALPFMAWSAGQREFMPLLLSFYWLTYIQKQNNDNEVLKLKKSLEFVVIEEPEMGLHPQAILSVVLMCLELLNQGYKLIISTHSPVLLEAVWAIRFLQRENSDVKFLHQLFNLEPSESMTELFENILQNKTFLTYYFDQQNDGVHVKDISSLDPGDLDTAIAEWGGLTSFSSRASEVVSQAAQEKL
ncbi:MAG: AAA family ATPase [Merismopediaceae bacterium]|nr:AAA family ATPase [Merismopediaceae bacterium]